MHRPLLPPFHAAASLLLTYCALTSNKAGAPQWALLLGCCALLPAAAILSTSWHRARLRLALIQLEHASRPRDVTSPTVTDADWDELARTCCLRGWESRGHDHDPEHCTRKDQTL